MDFYEFIEKTLEKKRGYKYHTYETIFHRKILELYHYGTLILKVDVEKKKVLYYLITSFSDKIAIEKTLSVLRLNVYTIYRSKMYEEVDGLFIPFTNDKKERNELIEKIKRLDKRLKSQIKKLNYSSIFKIADLFKDNDVHEIENEIKKRLKISEKVVKKYEMARKKLEKVDDGELLEFDNVFIITTKDSRFVIIPKLMKNKIYITISRYYYNYNSWIYQFMKNSIDFEKIKKLIKEASIEDLKKIDHDTLKKLPENIRKNILVEVV